MKIRTAEITNFRGISRLNLDFVNPRSGVARDLTCITGDNGSGKTTVLQAIAFVLSLATRKTREAEDFSWHGFLSERLSTLGAMRVELEIEFTEAEVTVTQQLFEEWEKSRSPEWRQTHHIVPPSDERHIRLTYSDGTLNSSRGYPGNHQFLGRYYIKSLRRTQPELQLLFPDVGDIFWFDQFRNLGSRVDPEDDENGRPTSWQAGVEQLREFLVGMWGFHTSPTPRRGTDYLAELEPQVARIFSGFSFKGVQPRTNGMNQKASDFYFLIQKDNRVYDIAEMSSGEQSVFSLMYEFVRLNIANSIVLIDELELHLHPPQQQALLSALPQLGMGCQYLITTHSPYLTEVIPDEQEIRLAGGRACL